MKPFNLKKEFNAIFGVIKNNKLLFTFSCILDLGFILSFFYFFLKIVYENIFPILLKVSEIMGNFKDLPADWESQAQQYIALSQSIEFIALYANLLRWLIILIFVVFVIWILFCGLGFSILSKIIDKKSSFFKYLGKFSLFSLFFYILIVLSFWLTIYLSMLNSKIIVPLFTQGVINFILVFLIIVITYFFILSLAQIRKKKIIPAFLDTFRIGVFKFLRVILVDFIALGAILLSLFLLFILFKIHFILFLVGGLVIFLPALSLVKIMYFYMVEKID